MFGIYLSETRYFVCLFVMKHSSIYSICYKFKIRNVPKLVSAAYWNIKSKHCSKELTETQLDDKCQFLADIEGICRLQLPNHLKHYGLQSISEHNGHLVPSVGEKIIIMSNVLTRAGNEGSRRFHIHGEGPYQGQDHISNQKKFLVGVFATLRGPPLLVLVLSILRSKYIVLRTRNFNPVKCHQTIWNTAGKFHHT